MSCLLYRSSEPYRSIIRLQNSFSSLDGPAEWSSPSRAEGAEISTIHGPDPEFYRACLMAAFEELKTAALGDSGATTTVDQ